MSQNVLQPNAPGHSIKDSKSTIMASEPPISNSASSSMTSWETDFVIPAYPSPDLVSFLLPDEITETVNTYLSIVTTFLQLDNDTFTTCSDPSSRSGSETLSFLSSYVHQRLHGIPTLSSKPLDDKIFNLIFRFIAQGRNISAWLDLRFLIASVCAWYESHTREIGALLALVFRRTKSQIRDQFSQFLSRYVESFESILSEDRDDIVTAFTGFRYMATLNNEIVDLLISNDGAFLSSLHIHYSIYHTTLTQSEKAAILYLFYTILVNLAFRASESSSTQNKKGKSTSANSEQIFFHLFQKLFAEYTVSQSPDVFFEDLNSKTPFAQVLGQWTREWKGASEAIEEISNLLSQLTIQTSSQQNTSVSQTDGDSVYHEELDDGDIERTSLISQVIDILPHLGDGFVEECLQYYNWDIEATISAILNETLPPNLSTLNHSKKRSLPPTRQTTTYTPDQRRNVFDNDAFDLKQISSTQIHRGRRDRASTNDLLNDKRFMQRHKEKIFKAVEAQEWDEYEDEYDDTYDDPSQVIPPARTHLKIIHDDVDEETAEDEEDGDTLPATSSASGGKAKGSVDEVEEKVYGVWKKDGNVFDRNARKSKERDELKSLTKWSDEQIEGWKRMIERDERVRRRLERKYENKVFQQTELPPASWRQVAESDEESGQEGAGRTAGRGAARGTRGGGRRSGGQTQSKGPSRGRGRGRGVSRGRARKDQIRNEYRPDAS